MVYIKQTASQQFFFVFLFPVSASYGLSCLYPVTHCLHLEDWDITYSCVISSRLGFSLPAPASYTNFTPQSQSTGVNFVHWHYSLRPQWYCFEDHTLVQVRLVRHRNKAFRLTIAPTQWAIIPAFTNITCQLTKASEFHAWQCGFAGEARASTHLRWQKLVQVWSSGLAQVQRPMDLLRRARALPRP